MDVMRHGADVEVVAPGTLRETVRTLLNQSLSIYNRA